MVNGWSQREVAKRAESFGYKMSDSSISGWEAGGSVQSVSVKQIKGLALALDLPERQILRAFLGSMGYPPEVDKGATVEEAIRADGRLSSEDRELLLTMVTQMRSRKTLSGLAGQGGTLGDLSRKATTLAELAEVAGNSGSEEADTVPRVAELAQDQVTLAATKGDYEEEGLEPGPGEGV